MILLFFARTHFVADFMVANNKNNNINSEETTTIHRGIFNETIHRGIFNEPIDKATPEIPSILIPDYPNQTNVSAVEHAIALSSSSNKEDAGVSPFALCNPTAQVQTLFTEPHWTLITFDKHGNKKNVGGDEFYIVYSDNTLIRRPKSHQRLIALIQDHDNGTYTLDFVTTPMEPILSQRFRDLGTLTIYFDYTCGIGRMGPPFKKHWNNKGSTSAVFTHTNVPQPRFRTFQHPPKPVNLSNFDFVNFIGASTMRDLVLQADEKWQPRIHLQQDFRSPLNTATVDDFVRTINRPETLQGNSDNNGTTALVLGSDVWDILSDDPNQGPGFEDHLSACTRAILLAKFLYPNVTVMWK
jgi:hypothetical protein